MIIYRESCLFENNLREEWLPKNQFSLHKINVHTLITDLHVLLHKLKVKI